MSIALAWIESGRSSFNNQIAVAVELLLPKDWNPSGLNTVVGLPGTIAFIYQALHGAMCLLSGQLPLAIKCAHTAIQCFGFNDPLSLLDHQRVLGWPHSLSGNARTAWEVLASLPERWDWLETAFGPLDEYHATIGAYYMALTIDDYARVVARGQIDRTVDTREIRVPLCFYRLASRTQRNSYQLLTGDMSSLRSIWTGHGVSDEQFMERWDYWITVSKTWVRRVYDLFRNPDVVLSRLPEDILTTQATNLGYNRVATGRC
jgi:hypothetical protein